MRTVMILAVAAALTAGCQAAKGSDEATQVKTLQKTVGKQRLIQTFTQLTPPPTNPDIFTKSDQDIIAWVRQIDHWTHQVLSSPVTGEMDEYAMREMRSQLARVYTPEMADRQIDYFYRYDPASGTYQANSTKAMLDLRSEWSRYELNKTQPAEGQYKLTLRGVNSGDFAENGMRHESSYTLQNGRVVIAEFSTES